MSENQGSSYYEQQAPVRDSNALRIMLIPILDKMESFLKGYRIETRINEDNQLETVKLQVGEAKCNEKGIQSIMMWMESKLNPHIVLGNVTESHYRNYLVRCHQNLASSLMKNRINYGISTANYKEIINILMEEFEIFMTRTIGAGAVKSITPTIQHREVHTQTATPEKKRGNFNIL